MRHKGLNSFDGSSCRGDLFTQFINVEMPCQIFTNIYIPSDFTEETCSIGTLSMESSSVSDRVLKLCLEPITINSVFVVFKVSLLHTSHLAFQGREID